MSTSTATGDRFAHSVARNASRSACSSRSSAVESSSAPGSASTSTREALPYQPSTQAWKRVPRRACGDGSAGTGRRRCCANSAGSLSSLTSADADRCAGQLHLAGRSCAPARARPAAGRRARPTGAARRRRPRRTAASRSSRHRPSPRGRAAAASSTCARRVGPTSAPNGSAGQVAVRTSEARGLVPPVVGRRRPSRRSRRARPRRAR